jgi:ubiquitin-protein ligase
MIDFNCNGCGRSYSVKEEFAGRKTRCKVCGAALVVPSPRTDKLAKVVVNVPPPAPAGRPPPRPVPPAPAERAPIPEAVRAWLEEARPTDKAPPDHRPVREAIPVARAKLPMRLRRLTADAAQLQLVFLDFEPSRVVAAMGDPPELYRIAYRIRGLARGNGGNPVVRRDHLVEIQMTSEYPRQAPLCKILTPIFHPNFDSSTICIGDHWTAGERLVDLIVRIGEMIAYQAYNIKSPLDGEAAMWADLNQHRLPIDNRDLRPPLADETF